ncbi:unnamed protein product [Gadus morhua 'NCC']
MSWKVEKGWHNTIFKPDILPHPVKVLTPEVVTAEQCPETTDGEEESDQDGERASLQGSGEVEQEESQEHSCTDHLMLLYPTT